MNEYYQEQTDYISQLKLCKLIDEKELKKEMNLSNVKLYNFDNIKDTVLKNTQEFLARREDIKHIKSVDAFWYDDLGKTIYLIEASEDHTKQEFTEKLKCSLFILCFLTGLTDFNLRKIKNIEYYFYSPKKKDKFAGLVKNKDNKSNPHGDIESLKKHIKDFFQIDSYINILSTNFDALQDKLIKLQN